MTYTEKIIDIETGEQTIRPYTVAEIEVVEARKQEIAAEIAQSNAEIKTKETARQAVLSKLGLTAEEAALLLA